MSDSHSENLRFLLGGAKKFQSTREMWVYLVGMFVVIFLSLVPTTFRAEFGLSVVEAFAYFFGVWAVGIAAWYSWRRRDRKRHSPAPADESDS